MSKRLLPLIPAGLVVEQVLPDQDRIVVHAQPVSAAAACPTCGYPSKRLHSRYTRILADLPWQGRLVSIHVRARRLRCVTPNCSRRIFTERLPGIADSLARRTTRLHEAQRQVGLALGGEPGARLAARLALPVSGDTLLRMVRAGTPPLMHAPRVLGVDDWAWRRGQRYGTILCDLERRRVVDLLPDRSAETLAGWLADRPGIEIVSRDRAGVYAEGARRGAPEAIQVADRWHLLANCSQALLEVVKRHLNRLRTPGIAREGRVDAAGLTDAERRSWDCWQRKHLRFEEVLRLHHGGVAIREIQRRLALGRNTIRRWLRDGGPEFRPVRPSTLDPYRTLLRRRWTEGCRNGAQLWRELREAGFRGSLRVVTEWTNRQRLSPGPRRIDFRGPSARGMVRLLTTDPTRLEAGERSLVAWLCTSMPEIATARELALRFAEIIRDRASDTLDAWLADAERSALRSFAAGLKQDETAVRAALTHDWSNGQVEGQITRLKLLKRQMYGRAKLDLLRARLIQVA